MKNLTLALVAMLMGSSAVAAPGYSATLAQPLTEKLEVVVANNLFRCEGSTCILISHPTDADSLQSCRALHRKVGTLTSYIAQGKPFDAARLEKCNAP